MPQHRTSCARKYWRKVEQHANLTDDTDMAQSKSRLCSSRLSPSNELEEDNFHLRNEELSEARDKNPTLRIVHENTFNTGLAADALTQVLWEFEKTENVESYKTALVTALRLNVNVSILKKNAMEMTASINCTLSRHVSSK